MPQRRQLILSWTLVALWAVVIFLMSAHTGSDFDGSGSLAAIKRWLVGLVAPVFGPDTDIVNVAAHFTEYLIFGVLLFAALRRSFAANPRDVACSANSAPLRRMPNPKWASVWMTALVAIAFASLYAVTDEFHQSFVPGRMCDPADWLTDTLGATLGVAVAALALRKKRG